MSEEMKVYLVETVDDLLENWFPTSVYLHRESAENCAEALRCDDGYIRQFARVVEMKVADTEACQMDADELDCGHVRNSSEKLEAENAKLRELVKEMAEFLTEAEWLQWPELRAEMQRLGIEVD